MKTFIRLICFVFLTVCLPVGALSAGVDNSLFASLLEAHVHDGVVDYAGLKEKENRLDSYLQVLAEVAPSELSSDERLAFYINAYNAWTLKLILMNYPGISSIKEAGSWFASPWKKKFVEIDGKKVSLDYVEHEVLRPTYRDPRIHFAVNCASKSCPPLRSEPYEGDRIGFQLDDATSQFLNDPEQTFLEADKLHVTKIFDWYMGDWGGEEEIIEFVVSYAKGAFKERILEVGNDLEVIYLPYDWSLNGK